MKSLVFRIVMMALLLLLVLVAVLSVRTMQRLPNAMIYFVRTTPTDFTLEPVGRQVNSRTTELMVSEILTQLITGPDQEEQRRGLSSSIPSETQILGLRLREDEVTVDLSADFETGGGTALMFGRLYQLLYSLTQIKEINQVYLLIEGEAVTVFSNEGLLLDNPWQRPSQLLPRW